MKKEIVVVASRNKHKIEEIQSIVGKFGYHTVSRDEAGVPTVEIEEDAETFEANSYKKAYEIMKMCNYITIADDSGLSVDALGGAPGVHSARFAGEDADDLANNKKLISLLENVPDEQRGARFVSVITLIYPDGEVIYARGECLGHIISKPRGNNGFGYDPYFVPRGHEKTFAELTMEEKNKISHRALALAELERELKNGRK
ncbi:MAG: RdgB/HAM1 family non-canonical purine NTP pyrophosphatase [Eubacteriales bacterium]|nr:RdgB/HAM1 family non-canonical purine NTP pyrophosphatase [Eubacteriales bacterium]MDD4390006.1 RdgB/HAM1 family non-canonical purine NTP pyrophosphatase [Eubacteriales bacterium]